MDMLSGLFEFGHSFIHLSLRFDVNDDINDNDFDNDFSHYELIIAEHRNNHNNHNNRMFVYNAKSVGSELVEMDSRGMRENAIIDLK